MTEPLSQAVEPSHIHAELGAVVEIAATLESAVQVGHPPRLVNEQGRALGEAERASTHARQPLPRHQRSPKHRRREEKLLEAAAGRLGVAERPPRLTHIRPRPWRKSENLDSGPASSGPGLNF